MHGTLCLGGAEVLRLSILEEYIRRGADNIEVVVLRKRGELADQIESLGIPLTVLGNRGGLLDFKGILKFAKWLRANKPAIIQSSQFLTNFHTSLARLLARTPVHIIEEHGIYKWKKWHHKLLDRWFNSRAEGVVACSHEVAKSASDDLKIDRRQITVIHNCVSNRHLNQKQLTDVERETKRAQLTGDEDPRFVFGIVGTLRWEKGHEFLIDAWKQLQAQGVLSNNDFLMIAGDGPLRTKLESQSKDFDNIRFMGSVTDTQQLLQCLDVFLLPSINEGFGIAIIEAMAAGVPVISTQSGGIPEIIETADLGTLVPVKDPEALVDAIKSLLESPQKAQKIGENGKKRVYERFIPKAYVDQLESMHRALLNKS